MTNGICPQLSFHLFRILPVAVLREAQSQLMALADLPWLSQVVVKPEATDAFLKLAAAATAAREEAGCLRFDLLRDVENQCRFMTYEASFRDSFTFFPLRQISLRAL